MRDAYWNNKRDTWGFKCGKMDTGGREDHARETAVTRLSQSNWRKSRDESKCDAAEIKFQRDVGKSFSTGPRRNLQKISMS